MLDTDILNQNSTNLKYNKIKKRFCNDVKLLKRMLKSLKYVLHFVRNYFHMTP